MFFLLCVFSEDDKDDFLSKMFHELKVSYGDLTEKDGFSVEILKSVYGNILRQDVKKELPDAGTFEWYLF